MQMQTARRLGSCDQARVLGATFAGLAPLAVWAFACPFKCLSTGQTKDVLCQVEQPANAYDSVVAMLQSWLVGGGAAMTAKLEDKEVSLSIGNGQFCWPSFQVAFLWS